MRRGGAREAARGGKNCGSGAGKSSTAMSEIGEWPLLYWKVLTWTQRAACWVCLFWELLPSSPSFLPRPSTKHQLQQRAAQQRQARSRLFLISGRTTQPPRVIHIHHGSRILQSRPQPRPHVGCVGLRRFCLCPVPRAHRALPATRPLIASPPRLVLSSSLHRLNLKQPDIPFGVRLAACCCSLPPHLPSLVPLVPVSTFTSREIASPPPSPPPPCLGVQSRHAPSQYEQSILCTTSSKRLPSWTQLVRVHPSSPSRREGPPSPAGGSVPVPQTQRPPVCPLPLA